MYSGSIWTLFRFFALFIIVKGYKDVWEDVLCDQIFSPDNCDLKKIPLLTVEDYERCAPAKFPLYARKYILGFAGRGVTYRENRIAFERVKIKPKMLRDISHSSLEVSALGQKVAFPIGLAPTGIQKLAHPHGENNTALAAADMKTIMIMSSISSNTLEETAASVRFSDANLWMQLYIFQNINYTIDIVRRAERNRFKALVLTVDSNIVPQISCDAKHITDIANYPLGNIPGTISDVRVGITTFEHIKWLKSITKLPIVAKGIMTGEDAEKAIIAGASAIIVSNHGGRQLDGVLSTIDALPSVVKAVNALLPRREVYLDGGVRNGFDVYKAIARGAKIVFIGKPVLFGMKIEGREGIKTVLRIMVSEFNDTMLLSGATNPSQISSDTVIPQFPITG